MNMHVLPADIYSMVNRGLLYGAKGETVKEIAVRGDVVIVEGVKGRFSVTRSQLKGEVDNDSREKFSYAKPKKKGTTIAPINSLF